MRMYYPHATSTKSVPWNKRLPLWNSARRICHEIQGNKHCEFQLALTERNREWPEEWSFWMRSVATTPEGGASGKATSHTCQAWWRRSPEQPLAYSVIHEIFQDTASNIIKTTFPSILQEFQTRLTRIITQNVEQSRKSQGRREGSGVS